MRIVECAGFDSPTSIPEEKIAGAIGYLFMWGRNGQHAHIVFDAEYGEILASYRNDIPGKVSVMGFVMADSRPDRVNSATWDPDRGEFFFQA